MSTRELCGVTIPDSRLAREATELVRDLESDLLFRHSTRVYFWAALAGTRKGLTFDPELLYVAAMFHDVGLTRRYGESQLRFEVDGANAARDFLRRHAIPEQDVERVWTAIALHTTPGVPEHMRPEIALVQAGAGMDVVGRGYEHFSDAERAAVIAAYPRGADFERGIIEAFYEGMRHRPDSTYGTFNDDVLAFREPGFERRDFCRAILGSPWARAGRAVAVRRSSGRKRSLGLSRVGRRAGVRLLACSQRAHVSASHGQPDTCADGFSRVSNFGRSASRAERSRLRRVVAARRA